MYSINYNLQHLNKKSLEMSALAKRNQYKTDQLTHAFKIYKIHNFLHSQQYNPLLSKPPSIPANFTQTQHKSTTNSWRKKCNNLELFIFLLFKTTLGCLFSF